MDEAPIDDAPLDEIRAIRRRISEECGHDPDRLVARLVALQEKYRDRLIPPAPLPRQDQPTA